MDRNFHDHVERTRFRPIACGQMGVAGALVFWTVSFALAAVLLLFLLPYTRRIAICVLPLVFIYSFCKQFAHLPQSVLGAACNWGMLMAWTAIAGHVEFFM